MKKTIVISNEVRGEILSDMQSELMWWYKFSVKTLKG